MTCFEFTEMFPVGNSAVDFIAAVKYRDGCICPECGCIHKGIYHRKYNGRFLYGNNCRSGFPALKGTVSENTRLDLRTWLYAMNSVNHFPQRHVCPAAERRARHGVLQVLPGVCSTESVRQWKGRNAGKVHAVVANCSEDGKQLSGKQLFNVLEKACRKNTAVMTDRFSGCNIPDKENKYNFVRLKADRTVTCSTGNGMHANGIESFRGCIETRRVEYL